MPVYRGALEMANEEITNTGKGQLTVAEAGRRGGIATRDRRGVEFLREIARRGGEVTKKRYGQLFSEFGKRGGRPRRPSLEDSGKGLPEKKGDERSAPESPSPA